MHVFLVVVAATLGLAVGSFLNVVIARVPERRSVVRPGSRCPSCETAITARDNVPLLSWLLLRGRCRRCAAPISLRYPLVEAGTAALFAGLVVRFPRDWAVVGYLVFAATLLAVAVIDLEHYIVPNRIVFPVAGASVPLLAFAAADGARWHTFERAVLAGVVSFVGLLVLHLISPRGMGMGDVKLAFVLGLYLGWLGWGEVALGLFLGFLLGAVAGVTLMVVGRRGRRDHLPFAPFLAAGAVATVLWGAPILHWYAGT